MEVKPGYKKTEVGVIPEEWEIEPLGKAGRWFSGGTPSMANDLYWNGDIPWVSAKDMKVSRLWDSILHVSEKAIGNGTRTAPTGAVLMVVRGMILAHTLPVALAMRPVAFNQDMKALVSRTGVHSEFILVWLQANSQRVLGIASESTHGTKRFASGDLFALKVALPPPPEQRAIAEALSAVDGLLGGLDRLIAKKRDLKQAAMQQLLTGQTRLPGFHAEWETQTVAELEKRRLVKLSRGKVISKKDIESTPGDFPIYSSSIHNDGLFGRYGPFMFDEELITWSVDGGGNFFHRPKHKFSVTNVCGFMRVDTSRISYRFFAAHLQLLHSRKSFDYQSKAHPSVVRKEYDVQLPTLAEQTAIAEVLTEMDLELAGLEQRREKTRALKQAMMQELLTGKTRLV